MTELQLNAGYGRARRGANLAWYALTEGNYARLTHLPTGRVWERSRPSENWRQEIVDTAVNA